MQKLNLIITTIVLLSISATNIYGSPNDDAGYRVEVKIKNTIDTVGYLGYPYGDKKYVHDTAKVENGNTFVFEGDEPLETGIYFFYTPNNIYFELIGDSQEIDIETDTSNLVANMKVNGSYGTKTFKSFQMFMQKSQQEAKQLREKLKSDPQNKADYQAQLQKLDKRVKAFRKEIINKKPESFVSKLIKATTDIEVPSPPAEAGGNKDNNWRYRYYKKHFFDNIDFSEPGMLRTPVFHRKIMKYLEELTYKHPDSIIQSAHDIIEKCKANKEVFRYCVVTISNKYETSKIMGMDAVFVDLAERYYLTGQAHWADSALVAKIAKRVGELKPLIGDQAPNFSVVDTTFTPVSLYNIDADYTVLYFYSPNCGHCKKKTPILRNIYNDKLKDMNVEVFATVTDAEKEIIDEWKSFIKKHNLNWVNTADPNTQSNFRAYYYIDRTPKIYILDKNKKIIAKRLDVEQIEDFISKQTEQQRNK